jgi:signal peptidase I
VFAVEAYSWFDTILHAFLIIIVLFVVFTRMSTVDGDSMLPTLVDQQRLMISDLLYTPAHNDIVVVWANWIPNDEGSYGKAIVKRVIGVAGDKIHIDYANGRVYRNDEQLSLEFIDGVLWEDGHRINTYTNEEEGCGGDFTVPEGYVFVMGDNRNNSTDSRSAMVGFVDTREIIGRAYLRVWPIGSFGNIYG